MANPKFITVTIESSLKVLELAAHLDGNDWFHGNRCHHFGLSSLEI